MVSRVCEVIMHDPSQVTPKFLCSTFESRRTSHTSLGVAFGLVTEDRKFQTA